MKRSKMQSPITNDCKVEVCYAKDGFKGAWYRAILGEAQTKSGHDNLVRVRYTTLLKENTWTPLTQFVEQSSVRPVPPKENLNDVDGVFEEGSVVDAYYKSGWWTGLVVKRKEEADDTTTYLVYFDSSPPDIIQFERKQLRAHLDWIDSIWVRPENKELNKSVFSRGTIVELRKREFDWCPAMIIKEVEDNEKSFIIKYFDNFISCSSGKSKTTIVNSRKVRPRQPLCFSSVGEYELLDHVEVFTGSEWCQGVVRGIITLGLEGRYMVSVGATKLASQFNYSHLRPPMEWDDGNWYKRPKPKSGNETPSGGKYYTRKRKRKEQGHNSDLSDTVLSSDRVVKNYAANVEETRAKDKIKVSPFAKKSPIWKTYETMEVFKRVPQSPHFNKLSEIREDFREGYALGLMATFSGLLEKLKDLEADVPISQLDSIKDSFTALKKHGFDVTRPLLRIEKLLAYKDRQLNILKKRKDLEKEMIVESSKKRNAEQEFDKLECKLLEVKHKILRLQRQEAALREQKEAAREQKDAAYKNICQSESCARELGVELEDVEFDFETILAAPW